MREYMFVPRFCGQYITVFLTQNLTFFTEEAWYHLSDYTNVQNKRYWRNINLKQTFEVPFMTKRFVCGVPLLLHKE
jgi:hypothetical protein